MIFPEKYDILDGRKNKERGSGEIFFGLVFCGFMLTGRLFVPEPDRTPQRKDAFAQRKQWSNV